MSQSVQLDLISGGHAELLLDDPDEFPSSYFVSMEHSGNARFWEVAVALLTHAGRSICRIGAALNGLGLTRRDLTNSAMKKLLQTQGYAFGVFRDFEPAFSELDAEGRKTFIFIRDPRDVVAQAYIARKYVGRGASAGHSAQALANEQNPHVRLAGFLRSADIERIALSYRRLTDFARSATNVTIFRFEDCMFTWRSVVADLIKQMDQPISRSYALTIADAIPSLAKIPPTEPNYDAMSASTLDDASLAHVEEQFADSMMFFGYVPKRPAGVAFTERQSEFLRAISARLRSVNAQCSELVLQANQESEKRNQSGSVQRLPHSDAQIERAAGVMIGHTEGDPVLLWRLKANARTEIELLGRRVTMEADSAGCRLVVGQPQTGEKTLAVYGCSLTFGWGINADETFCSLLQGALPTWRVENHGVGGYSGVQNLIQLQRDARWYAPEYVTFCWIRSHLIRNVGDPGWLQSLMRRDASRRPRMLSDRTAHFPCASLDPEGRLAIRSVRFPRWDLLDVDFEGLGYDSRYLDLVCCEIFKRAAEIVHERGGQFFVTTLLDQFSPQLRRMLDDTGIPVVDACVKGKEFTLLPDDGHPNAAANKIYAGRIREYLLNSGLARA